ncbi:uncharacterized protein LOC123501255 [Portunus trituberculatus]|uniref:uncharacterized protein LOC123501255 n=1 Tax=Portunus trituberculatus TaxID=210409 RepID=UPI001E1CE924|nr:uncharacterized protein LOC123501255 [Portunus trituberculatus]
MAMSGLGACAVAGVVIAMCVGVEGMPAPLPALSRCPAHPRPHPEQAVGRPSLTPPHPNIMVTVMMDKRVLPGGVRLIPASVEADVCVDEPTPFLVPVSNASITTLCYAHTDITIPTPSYNLLGGVDSRVLDWRHVFRRSVGGVAGDAVVVAVVTGASPPNGDNMYTTSLDKVAVRQVVRVVEGLAQKAVFNIRDLLPSPAVNLPYYQYRLGTVEATSGGAGQGGGGGGAGWWRGGGVRAGGRQACTRTSSSTY